MQTPSLHNRKFDNHVKIQISIVPTNNMGQNIKINVIIRSKWFPNNYFTIDGKFSFNIEISHDENHKTRENSFPFIGNLYLT